MSRAWLHVDPLPETGDRAALDADEARHASGARRLAPGDAVTLFDGRGGVAEARLEEGPTRRTLAARVERSVSVPRPRPALRLGVALPKGDRQATLVSMATQLGVAAVAPLACARSVARAGRNAEDRWARVAVAACKQSRNAWLPELLAETRPARFAAEESGRGPCLVLHPGSDARPIAAAARDAAERSPLPVSITVMVGPEGGFEASEVADCVAAGAVPVALGPTILRTETAAVAALAVVQAVCAAATGDAATAPAHPTDERDAPPIS